MSHSMELFPSAGQSMAQFTKSTIMGSNYEITSRYSNLQPISIGTTGLVCSANDQLSNETVAVKKLVEPFKTNQSAKYMFREVKLLKHLQHDNIIHLKDVFISPSEDIYLVTDQMATNLDTLLKSRRIDEQFTQYFLYQIIRGLKYVHSAGIIHRDLKPTNILINENCDLKICDFGFARMQESRMTGYVSTRYYRAPEIMLTFQRYTEKVDMWSVGCIFAEMILGRPILPGKDHIDQFCLITQLLGSPPDNVIASVTNPSTLDFLKSLPARPRKPISTVIPSASPDAAALLERILKFDPEERCSAADALTMKYLAPYHDPTDEPAATETSDWSYLDADMSTDQWKRTMNKEVLGFHMRTKSSSPQTQLETMVWN